MTLHKKDLKHYYSISEVAAMFHVSETLLRYWERKFPKEIAPKKNSAGQRQYTCDDIERIHTVYILVKERGLKLAAARKLLQRNPEGEEKKAQAVAALLALRNELSTLRNALSEL